MGRLELSASASMVSPDGHNTIQYNAHYETGLILFGTHTHSM